MAAQRGRLSLSMISDHGNEGDGAEVGLVVIWGVWGGL